MKTLVKGNIVTTAGSYQCQIPGFMWNLIDWPCKLCLSYCPVQTINCSATKPGMSPTNGPTESV